LTTLLIDGDYELYRIGFACEREFDWAGTGILSLYASVSESNEAFDWEMQVLKDKLGATDVRVALSDRTANWRKGVYPEYKQHREGQVRRSKPLPFFTMREYLLDVYGATILPSLEADDVLGLWLTEPTTEKRIIVGEDKDFLTLPGTFYNPEKDVTTESTVEMADMRHYMQTLTGDSTDGYCGLPGCGPVGAEKILAGHRPDQAWGAIVAAYERKGLTEEDALVQARCARILRHGEYNHKTKEVTLWMPKEAVDAS
jgi:DNA polymerase-1